MKPHPGIVRLDADLPNRAVRVNGFEEQRIDAGFRTSTTCVNSIEDTYSIAVE